MPSTAARRLGAIRGLPLSRRDVSTRGDAHLGLPPSSLSLSRRRLEGLRLLERASLPKAEKNRAREQLAQIEGALTKTSGSVAARTRRRRTTTPPVLRGNVLELACEFLDTPDLLALDACSRATHRVARLDSVWDLIALDLGFRALQGEGIVDKFPSSGSMARARRLFTLWTAHEGYRADGDEAPVPSLPGLGAYMALIIVDLSGRSGQDSLLTWMSDLRPSANNDAILADASPLNQLLPIQIDTLRISVAIVRKRDGGLMHVVTNSAVEDSNSWGEEDAFFGDVIGTRRSPIRPLELLQPLDEDDLRESDNVHMLDLVNCTWADDASSDAEFPTMASAGDLLLRVWDPLDDVDTLPCTTVLRGWAASQDWI